MTTLFLARMIALTVIPVIASFTARANAVKMLHNRIKLLKTYLDSLPPSYLTTPVPPNTTGGNATPPQTDLSSSTPEINHRLLRSILALLSRLPLLLPPSHLHSFRQDTLAEKADVELVTLLGGMGKSVKEAREMGRKFAIVDNLRSQNKKGQLGMGGTGDDGWNSESMGGLHESIVGGYMT